MTQKWSIFDAKSDWLKDDIYVHGVKDEIKEIAAMLGGPVALSKKLGVDYNNCFREWTCGRVPVRLSKLEQMIELCNSEFQSKIKEKIDAKELKISCKYSPHKVQFPKTITEDMAYCAGLILGDGTLSGDKPNSRGNWSISVCFDNPRHRDTYTEFVKNEFNILPKKYMDGENCWVACFGSKALHWSLRSFLEMHNGFKANKISIPKAILQSQDDKIKVALLQGLFDSDGTISKDGSVQYASTSKEIVEQVSQLLDDFGIAHSKAEWLKNEKVLLLHSVRIRAQSSVKRFAQQIGFRHPAKAAKLAQFSPIV